MDRSPKDAPAPFRVGETLNYRVAWASFATAASLQVTVPEKREIFGWPTWHFRAALHTQSPVRSLFTIDDQFDSYADAHIFDTRRYETYQNELGRKENHELNFMTVGQKPWGQGPDVVVPPGTHDPVERTVCAARRRLAAHPGISRSRLRWARTCIN